MCRQAGGESVPPPAFRDRRPQLENARQLLAHGEPRGFVPARREDRAEEQLDVGARARGTEAGSPARVGPEPEC
jgi:hypothetical protein